MTETKQGIIRRYLQRKEWEEEDDDGEEE